MSDPSEKETEEEYVSEIDATNYFKLQDEKFEELHKKLQKLKEENKKQIDAIINSLDDLMANKCVIEQTLDNVTHDDLPIEIPNEKLNIVDLLSKVTGVVNDANFSSCKINEDKECENKGDNVLPLHKEEDKNETACEMDCTDVKPNSDNSNEKSKTHNNDDLPTDSEITENSTRSRNQNKEYESKDDSVLPIHKEEDKSETACEMDCTDVKSKSDNSIEKNESHNNDDLPKDSEITGNSADSQLVQSEN